MLLLFVGRSSDHRRSAIRITTHPCLQLLLPRACPAPEVPVQVALGYRPFLVVKNTTVTQDRPI
jgi:hypothetical protein